MRIAFISAANLPYEHPEEYLTVEPTEIISDGVLVIPEQLDRYVKENRIPIATCKTLGLPRKHMTENETDIALLRAADLIYAFESASPDPAENDPPFDYSTTLIRYCRENDLPMIVYRLP